MAYKYFKQYAAFLLENHVDELTHLNIERAQQLEMPMLNLFAGYSPVQLFDYSKASLKKLLEDLVQGIALQSNRENIERWKADQVPGVPRGKVDAKDLAFLPATRRYAFIKLLRLYTQDIDQYEAILQDMDDFYAESLVLSLDAYIEVQQEELQKERDFFQTVIDHTGDGISAYDKDLRITLWNRSVERRTGLDRNRVMGKSMFDFFPDYTSSPDVKAMQRALEGESTELRNRPYQEKPGFYESELVPLKDPRKGIVGVLAISRDVTEQRQVAERIIRSEAIMAQAQSAAHFGSWELDVASNELRWSDEMYRIFGYEPQSIPVNYTWLREHVHPEDLPITDELLGNVMEHPQSFEFMQRIQRKDGSNCLLYVKGSVLTNEAGQVTRLVGATQDVTLQRQTEDQLRRSESYLKEAQAMAHVGYWEIDVLNDGMIWSEELYRIHGISIGTTIDIQVIKDLVHPDYAEALLEWIKHAAEGKEMTLFEHQVIDKQGQIKVLQSKGEVEKDRDGRVVRIKGISQDITEHRIAQREIVERNKELSQALEELRSAQDALIELNNELERRVAERTEELSASEEEMRLVTDALPVLIAYIDSEVRYRFNNKAYEDWFGISRSDLYGKYLWEIMGDEAYQAVQQTVQRALSGERFRFEAWLDYKDAGRRFVSVDYIPHINKGHVLGYYTLVNDITKQKQAQQALEDALNETNRKNEELKKINIDLDNFVYTASHDLKSPIANLEGITSILGKRLADKLDKKELELIDMINKMTVKLKGTIRDLTEITKVQKAFEQEIEPVYFAEILEDVKADIQPLMSDSGAEVLADFEVEGISYARKNLRSVIYNLVINGIKYQSPERKPVIQICTRREGDYVLLTVQDNGLGIPSNQLYKLFSMFKRLHTHVEGSGIGLYIIKRIIENNGGKIEVESHEGVGTTFKVFFKV